MGFSGPPSEPDVRLSPHPALHVLMPSNGDQNRSPPIGAALSASRVLGPPLHAGLATNRRYSPAASSFSVTAASTLDPFALYTAFPMLGLLRVLRPTPSASTGDRSSPLRTTRRRTSRDQRSGSHVHSRTLQRGRSQLCPCNLATATPQSFTVASRADDISRPRSFPPGPSRRVRVATQPTSVRLELVVLS